jgi:hypothetical protein
MDADRDRLLASVRGAGDPFQHYSGTGFRCVLERKPPRTAPVYEPPEKGAAGRSGPYTPPKALPLARFPAPLPANEVARRTVTNSLGMKFIPVPGAKVLFCIHETRQKDYEAFASDVKDASPGGTWRKVIFAGVEDVKGPDHPVSCISYDQAKLFCSWLSKKEGRTYRLPTDHEWSVAVGLGEVERDDPGVTPQMKGAVGRMEFPFGEKMPSKDTPRVGNYRDATFHERGLPDKWIEDYVDGYALSAPVMSFPPNAFGLYDMGGNVWEWVSDWATKLQDKRVIRGGSFVDLSPGTLQSACRYPVNSNAEQYNHGFRVVLEEVMPASSR